MGATGKPINASKFFNSTDIEYALKEAERLYALNPSLYKLNENKVSVDFCRPVGEGFMGDTKTNRSNSVVGEYRWTNIVTVGIDKETGKAYTAFPDLDHGKKLDNSLLKCIKNIGVYDNEDCKP